MKYAIALPINNTSSVTKKYHITFNQNQTITYLIKFGGGGERVSMKEQIHSFKRISKLHIFFNHQYYRGTDDKQPKNFPILTIGDELQLIVSCNSHYFLIWQF
jgi:hypothetical protein